jgi:hypothetical protein
MSEFGNCHCGKEAICMFGAGSDTMPLCEKHTKESFDAVNDLLRQISRGRESLT